VRSPNARSAAGGARSMDTHRGGHLGEPPVRIAGGPVGMKNLVVLTVWATDTTDQGGKPGSTEHPRLTARAGAFAGFNG
jgi:hypothetical protein